MQRTVTIALSVAYLLTLLQQSAFPQPMNDGKPVSRPNIASANGFTAQLWLMADAEFFERFGQGGNIRFDSTSHVRRDSPVFLTFFISGPGVDAAKAANVTADITIRKPDGSIYFEGKDAPCWSDEYPYTAESMQVADAKVKLRIEPKDPSGDYSVEAIVHDKIKKVDVHLQYAFDVAQ